LTEALTGTAQGAHTFRHTFASMHIAQGTNIVQLSRLIGHHDAGFTLSKYAHLMDGNLGEPLSLGGVHKVRTHALTHRDTEPKQLPMTTTSPARSSAPTSMCTDHFEDRDVRYDRARHAYRSKLGPTHVRTADPACY
jgi:hypothetical protein